MHPRRIFGVVVDGVVGRVVGAVGEAYEGVAPSCHAAVDKGDGAVRRDGDGAHAGIVGAVARALVVPSGEEVAHVVGAVAVVEDEDLEIARESPAGAVVAAVARGAVGRPDALDGVVGVGDDDLARGRAVEAVLIGHGGIGEVIDAALRCVHGAGDGHLAANILAVHR